MVDAGECVVRPFSARHGVCKFFGLAGLKVQRDGEEMTHSSYEVLGDKIL